MTPSSPGSFAIRALEIHNSRMWRWSAIAEALEFMSRAGMNTLVLHQNDLIDQIVFPARFVPAGIMYDRWPILRSTLVANRLYLSRLIAAAAAAGVGVMLEVKEISFPAELLEVRPDLRGPSGAVCPTHPFWDSYLRAKVEDLYEALPGLGGLILSIATRESKASLVTRACPCERCASADLRDWYETVLRAFAEPLRGRGRPLVVRDFAYRAEDQYALRAAAAAVSPDTVLAVKNVPHDFWPTFPHNPLLGAPELSKWAEFDAFGQYCGLGVVPCGLLADLRYRMRHCFDQGVSGVIIRSDWEMINDASAFNSLNMLNIHGAALISGDLSATDDAVYRSWLDRGVTTALQPESMRRTLEVPRGERALAVLRHMMDSTWPIVERALYTRGHVFQYSSKIAPTLDEFLFVAQSFHGREDWDPGSLAQVTPTYENVRAILREKDEALEMALALRRSVDVSDLGVSGELAADIRASLDLLVRHVQMYRHVVSSGFLTALALGSPHPGDRVRAAESIAALREFRLRTADWLARSAYPFYVYWLFDVDLLARFESDLGERLTVSPSGPGATAPAQLPPGAASGK